MKKSSKAKPKKKQMNVSLKEIFNNSLLYAGVYFLFLILMHYVNPYSYLSRHSFSLILFLSITSIIPFFFFELYFQYNKKGYSAMLAVLPLLALLDMVFGSLLGHPYFWKSILLSKILTLDLFVQSILALIPIKMLMAYRTTKDKPYYHLFLIDVFQVIVFVDLYSKLYSGVSFLIDIPEILKDSNVHLYLILIAGYIAYSVTGFVILYYFNKKNLRKALFAFTILFSLAFLYLSGTTIYTSLYIQPVSLGHFIDRTIKYLFFSILSFSGYLYLRRNIKK